MGSTNANLVLSESKTGQKRTIQYDQVKELKGEELSTAAKIAIAVVAGVLGTGDRNGISDGLAERSVNLIGLGPTT